MKVFFLIGLLSITLPVQAYIGPGMGAGAIAAVLGVFGALLLAIVGVVYYPVKRFLKKRKNKTEGDDIQR